MALKYAFQLARLHFHVPRYRLMKIAFPGPSEAVPINYGSLSVLTDLSFVPFDSCFIMLTLAHLLVSSDIYKKSVEHEGTFYEGLMAPQEA